MSRRTSEADAATARALRETMERVVLPPHPGVRPSERPPVEIFLGTEPAQYRANRVFGFSIEKVRDPGREVRIHLMSELDGFDRRGWTTGFTNYRFAIPGLAFGLGRAIYNDEDEIYLTDPGRLFDLDLGDAGYLAISDTESSVMLIDCERMAPVWTLAEAQHAWKRSLLRKASKATGLRGDLDPGWNARDEEFVPGRSHLLHYTTLHTQPWRPFPERFVYQEGAYTSLWHDLEREAIARGFELFHRDAPSKRFAVLRARLERLARGELPSGIGASGPIAQVVESLVRQAKGRSVLELLPDLRGEVETRPGRFGLDLERRMGLLEWLAEGRDPAEEIDGVVCADGLEGLPVWDIPWVIETLFERARGFVFVAVRCQASPRRRFLYPPAGTAFTPAWWRSHFEAAAVRHPHVRWELLTTGGRDFAHDGHRLARGGPRLDATPPRIWTLTDGEPDHEREASALANALGGAGASFGVESPPLIPPWPDLLIVAGRSVAERARRLREDAHGRCLVVALGGGAAIPVDAVDLAVVPRGDAIFPHPRLVEIDRPLVAPPLRTSLRAGSLGARLAALPGPRLVVRFDVGGGESGASSRALADFGGRVRESAARLGASVLLWTPPGASPAQLAVWQQALGEVAFPAPTSAEPTRDPAAREELGHALLAVGDVFIHAGESESALAELVATGRPVFVAPDPSGPRSTTDAGFIEPVRRRIAEAIVARARAKPANDRGTTRPQEGLEWLCAKAVEAGHVRPRSECEPLRAQMLAAGHVRTFATALSPADLSGFPPPPASELTRVAARVHALVGTSAVSDQPPSDPQRTRRSD